MKRFKISTAGESHGLKLTAIIENFPANFTIDQSKINQLLTLRQAKESRGQRQAIENDIVVFTAGLYNNKTTGAPICLEIVNSDYRESLGDANLTPRPGHADYFGMEKYNLKDINIVIERASARKTAIDVAVGGIFIQLLEYLEIEITSTIISANSLKINNEQQYLDAIKNNQIIGDTFGGEIITKVNNLPMGIGSYTSNERKLDSIIGQRILAINTVKGIMFGSEIDSGTNYVDEFVFDQEKNISITSNNSGGIVGGMSTAQQIFFTTTTKPIPTTLTPVNTVNLQTKENVKSEYIRSDISVLKALEVIINCETAIAVANEMYNSLATIENIENLKMDKLWKK